MGDNSARGRRPWPGSGPAEGGGFHDCCRRGGQSFPFQLQSAWRQSAAVHLLLILPTTRNFTSLTHAPGEHSLQPAIQWSTLHQSSSRRGGQSSLRQAGRRRAWIVLVQTDIEVVSMCSLCLAKEANLSPSQRKLNRTHGTSHRSPNPSHC